MTIGKNLNLKASRVIGQPIKNQSHFAMIEKSALEDMSGLIQKTPHAARLLVLLIKQLESGSGGVVVVSRATLKELLKVSLPTVDRAIKVLTEEGWVQRMRVGGAYALAVNERVAWVGDRTHIQHAVFSATVIASRAEQDAIALNPPKSKVIPITKEREQVIQVGEGNPPPVQSSFESMPASISLKTENF